MDINNNQQTNTFIKGMDTDTSDMYIGEGSYRYAENLRVVTNTDSNSGELHVIEGTNEITLDQNISGTLLGFTSIRDYILAIVLTEPAAAALAPRINPDVPLDPIDPDEPLHPDDPDGPGDGGDDSEDPGEHPGGGEIENPGDPGESGEESSDESEGSSSSTGPTWSIYRIKVVETSGGKTGQVSLVAGPFSE